MSSTAATADFTSARNPKGKAPSTAALRNEGQRINIPYDAKAWDHIKHLSPQDRDALGDFHLRCLHRQLTSGQVAELLGYEKSNVTRILTGQYQPQSASVWEKILNNIRAQDQAHLPIVHIGGVDHEPEFVETNASQRYLLALEYASRGGFSLMAGESGSGKNKTSAQWAQQNPGRLIPVTHPPLGGPPALVKRIADRLGIANRNYSAPAVFQTLEKKISSRQILWIDEAGRLLQSPHLSGLEVLRDLSDYTGCGVVLNLTWRDIDAMADVKFQIEQVIGRGEIFRAEPPTISQVSSIAKQFGDFSDATYVALHDLATKPGGLRTVTKILNIALRACKNDFDRMSDKAIAGAIGNRYERMGGKDPFYIAQDRRKKKSLR